MADELRNAFDVEPVLTPGSGGVFIVTVDGKVVYDKAATGRFPEPGEVVGLLQG